MGRGQEFCDFLKLGFATRKSIDFGFCDWNLVLGWVGLEIDGFRELNGSNDKQFLFISFLRV